MSKKALEFLSSDRRVFSLVVEEPTKVRLHSIEASEIQPGMQGDFFLVKGKEIIYVFAGPDIHLSCELLCIATGLKIGEVAWLPDEKLNSTDVSFLTSLALRRRLGEFENEGGADRTPKAWCLKRLAENILEHRVQLEDESPWQKGLVLVAVQSVWEGLCQSLGDEGESFWGWALQHTQSKQSGDGDDSRRKTMSGWMNAVRTFLLNEHDVAWVKCFTWSDFQGVSMSKCIRAVGMTRRGLMTARMMAGLFDSSVKVVRMRHLLGQGTTSGVEEERVETDVTVTDIADGELMGAYEQAANELTHEAWERLASQQPNLTSSFREYDSKKGVFSIWRGDVKIGALAIMNRGDLDVQEWVEEIIAATRVRMRKYGTD